MRGGDAPVDMQKLEVQAVVDTAFVQREMKQAIAFCAQSDAHALLQRRFGLKLHEEAEWEGISCAELVSRLCDEVQEERELAAKDKAPPEESATGTLQVEVVVMGCKALREPEFDLAEGMLQGLMFSSESYTQEHRAFIHASISGEWKQTGDATRHAGDLDWESDLEEGEEDEVQDEVADELEPNKLQFEYQQDAAKLVLEVRQHKAPSSTSMTGMVLGAGMAASAAMSQFGISTSNVDRTGTSGRSRGNGVVQANSELIGHVSLPLEELRMSSGIPLWHELEPEGTVKLQINWLGIGTSRGWVGGTGSSEEGSDSRDSSESSGYSSCHSGGSTDEDGCNDEVATAAADAVAADDACSFPFLVLTVEAHRCKSLPAPRVLVGNGNGSTADRTLSDPMLSVTLQPSGLACPKGAAAVASLAGAAAVANAWLVVAESETALLVANIDPLIPDGGMQTVEMADEQVEEHERRRRRRMRRRRRRAVRYMRLHTMASAQHCNQVTHRAVSGGVNPDWQGANHQRLFMMSITNRSKLHFVFPIVGGGAEGESTCERRGVIGNTTMGLSGAGVGARVDGEAFSQVERFCSSLLLRVHETKADALLPRAVYLARSKARAAAKVVEDQQKAGQCEKLKARLSAFYAVHNPEKISMVPALVEHFGADKERVNRRLQERYGGVDLDTDKDIAIAMIAAARAAAGGTLLPSPPLSPVSAPPLLPPMEEQLDLGEAKEGGLRKGGKGGGTEKYKELFGGKTEKQGGGGPGEDACVAGGKKGVEGVDGSDTVAKAGAAPQVVRPSLKLVVQPMVSVAGAEGGGHSKGGEDWVYGGGRSPLEGYCTPVSVDEGYCTPLSADEEEDVEGGGRSDTEGGNTNGATPPVVSPAVLHKGNTSKQEKRPLSTQRNTLDVSGGSNSADMPATCATPCMCTAVGKKGARFELGRAKVDLAALRRSLLFGMPLWHELDTEGSVLCTIRLGKGTYTHHACQDGNGEEEGSTKHGKLSAFQQQQIAKQIQEAIAASAAAAAADEAAEAEEVVFMDAGSPSVAHGQPPSVGLPSPSRRSDWLSDQGKTFRSNGEEVMRSMQERGEVMDVQERGEVMDVQPAADPKQQSAEQLEERHELERMLRIYYRQYNPQKLTDGSLAAIIDWGTRHPEELERRLVEQYGQGIGAATRAICTDMEEEVVEANSPTGFEDVSLD
jgi:hypothetical protein